MRADDAFIPVSEPRVTANPGVTGAAPVYRYRPSLVGAGWEFTLTRDGIDWTAGRQSGHVPYDKVRRVRLSYRPANMQAHRFLLELWAEDGPKLRILSTSWKSMFDQERLDKAYVDFVVALHDRLAAAGAPALYQRGYNPLIYWAGVAVFAGVAFGLLYLIGRALADGVFSGAAFVAAFLALFVWQGSNFIRRNRPGLYRPDDVPAALLPKG